MAIFTMTMALDTGGTLTETSSLTDANATRIIEAYRAILRAPAGASTQAVWSRIEAQIFDELKSNTMNQEKAVGVAAIVVQPIP
jgi:hypothetical protein